MFTTVGIVAKRLRLPTGLADKPPALWDPDDVDTWVLSWGEVFQLAATTAMDTHPHST